MEEAFSIAQEYNRENNELIRKYNQKCSIALSKELLTNIEDFWKNILFNNLDTTHNILVRYNQVYEKYVQEKDDIVKDILCANLAFQYTNICKVQQDFVKLLGISKDIETVTIKALCRYFEVIGQIHSSLRVYYEFTLKQIMKDLESIHDKHHLIFIKAQDEIYENDETYDNQFITMSNNDITEHNTKLLEQISKDKKQYTSEETFKSNVIPNLQIRQDPPLHVGC